MRRLLRIFIVTLSILWVITRAESVQAGPFVDFFRTIRNSINQADKKESSHRRTHRRGNAVASSKRAGDKPTDQQNVRATKVAHSDKDRKAGLRYGTPVPGKQGFVTSPFAPDGAFIDVRGFPPGTEVKDPDTGKVFLTP